MAEAAPISLSDVKQSIQLFKTALVPTGLRDTFELSEPYQLFPSEDAPADWGPKVYWGDKWKQRGNVAVYMHFSKTDSLLYVGKATFVEDRLRDYFSDDNGSCKLVNPERHAEFWFVRSIIMDGEPLKFLAPALEWWLIDKLGPPVNRQMRKKSPLAQDAV